MIPAVLRPSVTRRAGLVGLVVCLFSLAALGAAAWLVVGTPGEEPTRVASTNAAAVTSDVDLPPLPSGSRAQVVQPVAGSEADTTDSGEADLGVADPAPERAATKTSRRKARDNGAAAPATTPTVGSSNLSGSSAVSKATALGNGVALPPLDAPEAVKQIISAGNSIARTPYIWGGGHGKWLDKGYDCSGSVSYALAAAGLLNSPLTSGALAQWGQSGKGKWVTIWANDGHVFMEVAGIRFDTSASRVTGSRWAPTGRSTAGFTARHPAGL